MITNLKPGESLPPLEKDIDQARINGWAALSGDFNRLHVDPGYARQTPFKGTISHGPLSLAFLNEFMMACFGIQWARTGKLQDVRFVAPVRPGERIKIGGILQSTRKIEQGWEIGCDVFIEKPGNEKAVVGRASVEIPEGKT